MLRFFPSPRKTSAVGIIARFCLALHPSTEILNRLLLRAQDKAMSFPPSALCRFREQRANTPFGGGIVALADFHVANDAALID